jgi:hypothetical protein
MSKWNYPLEVHGLIADKSKYLYTMCEDFIQVCW